MWIKMNLSDPTEDAVYYAWDYYTFTLDGCTVLREEINPEATMVRHVDFTPHSCEKHPVFWVAWPPWPLTSTRPRGPQVHISGALDRNDTLEVLP